MPTTGARIMSAGPRRPRRSSRSRGSRSVPAGRRRFVRGGSPGRDGRARSAIRRWATSRRNSNSTTSASWSLTEAKPPAGLIGPPNCAPDFLPSADLTPRAGTPMLSPCPKRLIARENRRFRASEGLRPPAREPQHSPGHPFRPLSSPRPHSPRPAGLLRRLDEKANSFQS